MVQLNLMQKSASLKWKATPDSDLVLKLPVSLKEQTMTANMERIYRPNGPFIEVWRVGSRCYRSMLTECGYVPRRYWGEEHFSPLHSHEDAGDTLGGYLLDGYGSEKQYKEDFNEDPRPPPGIEIEAPGSRSNKSREQWGKML
jgi:hypothetical protein